MKSIDCNPEHIATAFTATPTGQPLLFANSSTFDFAWTQNSSINVVISVVKSSRSKRCELYIVGCSLEKARIRKAKETHDFLIRIPRWTAGPGFGGWARAKTGWCGSIVVTLLSFTNRPLPLVASRCRRAWLHHPLADRVLPKAQRRAFGVFALIRYRLLYHETSVASKNES
jgi:hypothetical protein